MNFLFEFSGNRGFTQWLFWLCDRLYCFGVMNLNSCFLIWINMLYIYSLIFTRGTVNRDVFPCEFYSKIIFEIYLIYIFVLYLQPNMLVFFLSQKPSQNLACNSTASDFVYFWMLKETFSNILNMKFINCIVSIVLWSLWYNSSVIGNLTS